MNESMAEEVALQVFDAAAVATAMRCADCGGGVHTVMFEYFSVDSNRKKIIM